MDVDSSARRIRVWGSDGVNGGQRKVEKGSINQSQSRSGQAKGRRGGGGGLEGVIVLLLPALILLRPPSSTDLTEILISARYIR